MCQQPGWLSRHFAPTSGHPVGDKVHVCIRSIRWAVALEFIHEARPVERQAVPFASPGAATTNWWSPYRNQALVIPPNPGLPAGIVSNSFFHCHAKSAEPAGKSTAQAGKRPHRTPRPFCGWLLYRAGPRAPVSTARSCTGLCLRCIVQRYTTPS